MIFQDVQSLFLTLISQMNTDNPEEKPTLTLEYKTFGMLAVCGLRELKLEKDREIARLAAEIDKLKSKACRYQRSSILI